MSAVESKIDLDPDGLLKLLTTRNYKALNKRLAQYQKSYVQDNEKEWVLIRAFDVFEIPDPANATFLDEWVEKHPNSYGAHVARAAYWKAMGWQFRGSAFSNKTADLKFQRMNKALKSQKRS